MATEVLGFPTTQGLPHTARRNGPEALRAAGLLRNLARQGHSVIDLGDLPLPPGEQTAPPGRRVEKVAASARIQAETWLSRHRPGNLMLTLGGDHTTSLGTLQALHQMGHRFDTVWIDAHGDFNILTTSPSGNPHGMVLALACGLMPRYFAPVVAPADLHLWGIRSLDPGERKLLEGERVEVLSPEQLRHDWDHVINRLADDVFISFDIDAVDPAEAPGTMTPIPAGLHRSETLALIAAIARRRRLLALDIVEYHPDRDVDDLTADLAIQAAEVAISAKVVFVA